MAHGKINDKAQRPRATVGIDKPRAEWLHSRVVWLIVLIVVAAAIGTGVWLFTRPPGVDEATESAEVNTLQSSLSTALDDADNQTIINVTTQLINGAKVGNFSLSNSQLAQYYLDRASAYVGQNEYTQATSDSEAAAQEDSNVKLSALQIEFEARYQNGERQQLVPLLQQIIALEKNSNSPRWGTVAAQYQEDIQDIQSNQEISF